MKIFLCFIFLVKYSYCVDSRHFDYNYWLNTGDAISQDEYNDHHDPIHRPCSIKNLDCIRQILSFNTMCTPVHGPAPDPYLLKHFSIEMPHCNITLVLKDPHIIGLNTGKVREFYINKKTKTLVLEVEFDSIEVDTPHTTAVYHREGKEPIERSADTYIDFRRFSLTLVIRDFGDFTHFSSSVYAHFTDPKPPVRVGKGINDTKDPWLIKRNNKWQNEILLSAKEGFIIQGPVYMSLFMNTKICDFGRIIGYPTI